MARMETTLFETSEIAGAGGMPDALFELGLMHCAGRDAAHSASPASGWRVTDRTA